MALQPGKGKVDGKHYLPSTPETVRWGELPTAGTRPVLSVESGLAVTVDTVSQEGILEDQGRDPDAFFGRFGVARSEVLDDARTIAMSGIPHRFGVDGPHVVTGPVFVRGAEPGDVLRVDVVSLHPRARYGVVSTRHGAGLLAGEFPEGEPPDPDAGARNWAAFRTTSSFSAVERRRGRLFGTLGGVDGRKVRFPLSPFMGIMSVAVDGAGLVRSTSVGVHGGALDCRELGVGARLFLPVQVPGALFAVGDPHYALGDGKIANVALEGPLRATFRLTALKETATRAALGALREPFIETDTHCHDLWMRMNGVPDDSTLWRALVAYSCEPTTLPLFIAAHGAADRTHTALLVAQTVTFFEDLDVRDWHLIRTEVPYSGGGRVHGRGQVLDSRGVPRALFTSVGLFRAAAGG
ncbi:acetamidase/formamidase family protein [Frankia sp. Cppng1_Ct_nod]|uniref:acetamidase/formamidase family protein n=1 Tax=Frankia sp. Cppng1_Ct_nod TaxID=2897162 RepID=UPI002025608A|nr:acetamidase/formamidase family protein [Frankia sp. Cppng1_Ct_nod]